MESISLVQCLQKGEEVSFTLFSQYEHGKVFAMDWINLFFALTATFESLRNLEIASLFWSGLLSQAARDPLSLWTWIALAWALMRALSARPPCLQGEGKSVNWYLVLSLKQGLESIIDLMLFSLSRPLSADASAISLEGSPLWPLIFAKITRLNHDW